MVGAGRARSANVGLSSRLDRLEPSALLFLAAVLVLAFMVVVPLGWLLLTSVQDPLTQGLTLDNYRTAFTQTLYLRPILNSFEMAFAVATIAVVVGTPLAWVVARTDVPGRGVIRPLVLAAFVTPSFLGAEAWIFLAAPNSGMLNKIWEQMFHVEHGPFDVYTFPFAIFVIALYSIPYTFSLVSATLELMASELEDAATTLGSGTFRTTFSITLPLAMPAILSGFLLSFLEALELFGPPAFLLIPARTQVMTTQLFLFFSQFPPQIEVAAAYAMPLLLVTVTLLFVQRRLLGRRRFTTVSGKGGVRRPMALGVWRWPFATLALLPPLLAVILPYGALLVVSLQHSWGLGPWHPGNLTLYWYQWAVFINPTTKTAISHSLEYGAAAATLAVVVATLVAYLSVRRLGPGAPLLGFLAMAPFVVPGIVLAIGFIAAYGHPPILLYGTAAIMIVAYATRFMPIAYSNSSAILQGLNVDLENAARTLGAGRLRSLWAVTLPLLRRGLLSGWLLVFIPALRELSASVFLFTPRTSVITTVIYDFSDAGNYEAVSTMGLLMMLITLLIVVGAYRFLGRDVTATRAR
ncbi:MAG TPA: iron ABC transporter permease [Candidatus Dormibacteraeota bacterium]